MKQFTRLGFLLALSFIVPRSSLTAQQTFPTSAPSDERTGFLPLLASSPTTTASRIPSRSWLRRVLLARTPTTAKGKFVKAF